MLIVSVIQTVRGNHTPCRWSHTDWLKFHPNPCFAIFAGLGPFQCIIWALCIFVRPHFLSIHVGLLCLSAPPAHGNQFNQFNKSITMSRHSMSPSVSPLKPDAGAVPPPAIVAFSAPSWWVPMLLLAVFGSPHSLGDSFWVVPRCIHQIYTS